MSSVYLLLLVIAPLMLVELFRSTRNEKWLRANGAIEPPGDPHALMAIVYPGMFVLMTAEGWLRGGAPRPWLIAGAIVFTLGKLLKYYAILTLGRRWSFRVLPLPNAPLIATGPYRYMRHPNYVALAAELGGAAVMLGAPLTGPLTCLLFAILLIRRIKVEERALGLKSTS